MSLIGSPGGGYIFLPANYLLEYGGTDAAGRLYLNVYFNGNLFHGTSCVCLGLTHGISKSALYLAVHVRVRRL